MSDQPPIPQQEPPLYQAIRCGYVEKVRLQLAQKQDLNVILPEFGTPLLHACLYNRPEIARILIESGAAVDVNPVLWGDYSYLHFVAEQGKKEIVELLISKGANVNQQTNDGKTPLHCASQWKWIEVVRILTNTEGIIIDKADQNGQTPLQVAAGSGCVDVARILIQNNANIENVTSSGRTPLYLSVELGHIEMTRLLLEAQANPNRSNNQGVGWSALGLACWKGFTEIAQLLLKYGADPNVKNKKNQSPLILAVNFGFLDIVKSLLNHNVRVDKDSWAMRPDISEETRSIMIDLLQREWTKQSKSVQIVDLTEMNTNHFSNRSFTFTCRSVPMQCTDAIQGESLQVVVQIDVLSVEAVAFILKVGYNDNIHKVTTSFARKEKKQIKHLYLHVDGHEEIQIEEQDTLGGIVKRYGIQRNTFLVENAMTIYAYSSRTFVVALQSPDVVTTSCIDQRKGISKNNEGLGGVLHQEVIKFFDALSKAAQKTGRAVHTNHSSLFAQDNTPSIVQSIEEFTIILSNAMNGEAPFQKCILPQMGDEIIIYYTGHGNPGTGEWRLQGKAQVYGINTELFNFRSIYDLILRSKTKIPITIVSDCCHSGRWVELLNEIKSNNEVQQLIVRVIATCEASQKAGTLVFSSFLKHFMETDEFEDNKLDRQIITCCDMNFHQKDSILQSLVNFID
eukprot:TRINITY_DN6818_c2_g1_i1.p1 TRINITY_DN6818_c2_g1~~TRINITY_DN6818_c2_g1_i1.p1  ORF type:complete len:681 (+),score=92.26 TRINITY_DN6818_c2_g1_i1:22-2064(+)